jgi:predicted nucleic acid-binding protein
VQEICDPSLRNLIIIAEITETEIASALNQLARGNVIRRRSRDIALAAFWTQVNNRDYIVVPISSTIIRQAAELCNVRPLKSMDALQLACALSARDDLHRAVAANAASGGPTFDDPIFLTEDNKLRDAAVAEGFVVDTPINHTSGS